MGSLFPAAATLSQHDFSWRLRGREHVRDRREQDMASVFTIGCYCDSSLSSLNTYLHPKIHRSQPHSSSAALLAAGWHPGCLCQSWGEKPGDTTALGGDEDRGVTDGDKGWLRPRHRISITGTMITMCNNQCATTIRVNYTTTAGVISWPTLATHYGKYLHYAHKTSSRAVKGVNA